MASHPEPESLEELFPLVLRHPLVPPPQGDEDEDHFERRQRLAAWFRTLRRECPLWCFDPWAYYNLQNSGAPTPYPLQVIINSILQDEGLDPSTQEHLEPLAATVDRRRTRLAHDRIAYTDRDHFDSTDRELHPGLTEFREAPELFHPGSESEYHFDLPHHEATWVGLEICSRIESRERARLLGNADRAREIQEELEDYLQDLGALQSQGRPRSRPPDELIQSLVEQGRRLAEVVWGSWPVEVSDETRQLLERHDISTDEQWLWVLNLVLPVFSRIELRGLADQIQTAANWGDRAGPRPTPRRTSIQIVGHRLDEAPSSVARIHAGGSGGAYEEIRYSRNPFQALTDE